MRAETPSDRSAALALLTRFATGDVSCLAADATADAARPIGKVDAAGYAATMTELCRALPDMERRDEIFVSGPNQPDARWQHARAPHLVAALGSYVGTFREPFLGIPPTGGVVHLDYGEAHHIEDGKIRASWLVWDIAGLMMQAGCWPMGAPFGHAGYVPGPKYGGGVLTGAPQDGDSLDRVLAMHDALHLFDGKDIESMPMHHWAENFMYYAAGNIGTCRGLDGFRVHHQLPFLRAFPDRAGAGHFVRVSDGLFAVTGGDVTMTHTGADYLGVAASGRRLNFRVMDFYRFDADGLIAENWLPNDTVGMMEQMGVDVMARMRHLIGDPIRTL